MIMMLMMNIEYERNAHASFELVLSIKLMMFDFAFSNHIELQNADHVLQSLNAQFDL